MNIRLVKAFSTEDFELKKLQLLKDRMNRTFGSSDRIFSPVVQYLNKIADTLLTFFVGKETIFGKMDYAEFSLFRNYSNQLQKSFQNLKRAYPSYVHTYRGWKRFFETYEYENKIISIKDYIPKKEEEVNYNIEFKNVGFSYPLKPDVQIFKNLSFKILAGKITAFVGYSGAGKSTIANLIQRLYDPSNGEIFLNNINLKDYNIKWLHQKIGCVSQEPILNSGTIEENITYGLKDYSKEVFNEITKLSNLDFVDDKNLFPDGYNSLVGERGSKISGGQKQRIAIARALMRDAKILILDEATSALDAKNEKELQDSINEISKKKKITVIIIAHRLSTIKNADNIMFLNKGEIIESGTHQELIQKNGEYLKLINNQLENKLLKT